MSMELVNQFKDYMPKQDGPTLFDGLIDNLKETKKHTDSSQVKELAQDEAEAANTISDTLLDILEKVNPVSVFLKDNKEASDVVSQGNDHVSEMNGLLKKVSGLNCITKY